AKKLWRQSPIGSKGAELAMDEMELKAPAGEEGGQKPPPLPKREITPEQRQERLQQFRVKIIDDLARQGIDPKAAAEETLALAKSPDKLAVKRAIADPDGVPGQELKALVAARVRTRVV